MIPFCNSNGLPEITDEKASWGRDVLEEGKRCSPDCWRLVICLIVCVCHTGVPPVLCFPSLCTSLTDKRIERSPPKPHQDQSALVSMRQTLITSLCKVASSLPVSSEEAPALRFTTLHNYQSDGRFWSRRLLGLQAKPGIKSLIQYRKMRRCRIEHERV